MVELKNYLELLHFRIYSLYKNKFKSDIAGVYSLSVIVLIVFLYLSFIVSIVNIIFNDIIVVSKFRIIFFMLFLYLFFGIKFFVISNINKKNESLPPILNLKKHIIYNAILITVLIIITRLLSIIVG